MIRTMALQNNEYKNYVCYTGTFISFSETGVEGLVYGFSDRKAKYLQGYSKLDLAYFFRLKDSFKLCTVFHKKTKKELYSGPITFYYNKKTQTILPFEISYDLFLDIVRQEHIVSLSSEIKLFEDKIVLDASIKEDDFILNEIQNLLITEDIKLDEFLLKVKKEIKAVQKCLNKLQQYDESKFEFNNFMKTPHSFLFGSKPIEVILRGDGEHLVKWVKSSSIAI